MGLSEYGKAFYTTTFINRIICFLMKDTIAKQVFFFMGKEKRFYTKKEIADQIYPDYKGDRVSKLSNSGCFDVLLSLGIVQRFNKPKGTGFLWRLSSLGKWAYEKMKALTNSWRDPEVFLPSDENLRLKMISKGWVISNFMRNRIKIPCDSLNALSVWLIEYLFAPPCELISLNPESSKPLEIDISYEREKFSIALAVRILADGRINGDNRIEKLIEYEILSKTVAYLETVLSLDDEIPSVYSPDDLLRECLSSSFNIGSFNGLLEILYESTLKIPEKRLGEYDCI